MHPASKNVVFYTVVKKAMIYLLLEFNILPSLDTFYIINTYLFCLFEVICSTGKFSIRQHNNFQDHNSQPTDAQDNLSIKETLFWLGKWVTMNVQHDKLPKEARVNLSELCSTPCVIATHLVSPFGHNFEAPGNLQVVGSAYGKGKGNPDAPRMVIQLARRTW